nr:RNA polymerase III subunit RPC8 [Andalucia godoyi]|eukprot:ANDGO_05047.mRNA.1 DNA-directed RNA polymerase III subunit rpc8
MFQLVTIRDTIYVKPEHLGAGLLDSLHLSIHHRYVGRHVDQVGFSVAVWDISEFGEPFVTAGQGGCHVKSAFRLLVFVAAVGSVVLGVVEQSVRNKGVIVSLSPWNVKILVPEDSLQDVSEFDEQEGCYVWVYDGHPLFMDKGEQIRVRITSLSDTEIRGTIQQEGLGMVSWWR